MGILSSLNREQREAVGLLQIGTFLEFFDLMLYVHMAVLLNELFFPKTNPQMAALVSAFSFSTTFVFRPFGGIIFGYLGDTIGRKGTVVLTTFLMALSCLIMAMLPTYEKIGITAAWLVTICRILQSISSMGERVGSELYLTETNNAPARYPIVALLTVASSVGGAVALAMSYLVTSSDSIIGWRLVFLVGTVVALIGSIARTTLRESVDFADAKRRVQNVIKESNEDPLIIKNNIIFQEKVRVASVVSLFLIKCTWPVCLYFFYIHCGNILKNLFSFTAQQVICQSLIVSLGQLIGDSIVAYLSYKIYPLRILKIKLIMFFMFIVVCPYLLNNISSSYELLAIQIFAVVFVPTIYPAAPVFYIHFPVFKRFTCACVVYALSHAIMSTVASFGTVYLTGYFGHYGLLMIMFPILFGYTFGLIHFEKLEKMVGNYPEKKTHTFSESLVPLR